MYLFRCVNSTHSLTIHHLRCNRTRERNGYYSSCNWAIVCVEVRAAAACRCVCVHETLQGLDFDIDSNKEQGRRPHWECVEPFCLGLCLFSLTVVRCVQEKMNGTQAAMTNRKKKMLRCLRSCVSSITYLTRDWASKSTTRARRSTRWWMIDEVFGNSIARVSSTLKLWKNAFSPQVKRSFNNATRRSYMFAASIYRKFAKRSPHAAMDILSGRQRRSETANSRNCRARGVHKLRAADVASMDDRLTALENESHQRVSDRCTVFDSDFQANIWCALPTPIGHFPPNYHYPFSVQGIRPDGQKQQHYYNEISVAIAAGILICALQAAGLNSLVTFCQHQSHRLLIFRHNRTGYNSVELRSQYSHSARSSRQRKALDFAASGIRCHGLSCARLAEKVPRWNCRIPLNHGENRATKWAVKPRFIFSILRQFLATIYWEKKFPEKLIAQNVNQIKFYSPYLERER